MVHRIVGGDSARGGFCGKAGFGFERVRRWVSEFVFELLLVAVLLSIVFVWLDVFGVV